MPTAPKALLVAAGIGSRLAPLTDVLPKCLMPVAGRPLLGLWLQMLADAGIGDIVVNLHHHAGLVQDYLARSPHADAVTTSAETELLGTAGTLLNHRERLSSGPTLFAHADNLTIFSPADFFAAHQARPAHTVMTMMTFRTDNPGQCGIVELDKQGTVLALHEKVANPPGNLANAAVYIVEPAVLDFIASLGKRKVDFSTEVLPHFMGRSYSVHNSLYHRDIGTIPSLAAAQFEYPLVAGWNDAQKGDPWYGLMSEHQGRLARDFVACVNRALAGCRP